MADLSMDILSPHTLEEIFNEILAELLYESGNEMKQLVTLVDIATYMSDAHGLHGFSLKFFDSETHEVIIQPIAKP